MRLIMISCRKSKSNNAIRIVTHAPLGFWPVLGVMLTHLLFHRVLRLDNQVGPVGSTLCKPMLTLPSHLLLRFSKSMFQEDSFHYFPRSGVYTLLFDSLRDLEPCFKYLMLPLIITHPHSSSLASE